MASYELSSLLMNAITIMDHFRTTEDRSLIKKAMGRYGGNVSQAAKALGLSRSALYRRLQHHRL